MKLTSWSASAHGRAIIIEGTDDQGRPTEITDVVEIRNDWRKGETWAIRRAGSNKSQPGGSGEEGDGLRVRLS